MREKTEDYIWLHREDRQTDRQTRQDRSSALNDTVGDKSDIT